MSDVKLLMNPTMYFLALRIGRERQYTVVLSGTTELGLVHHSHIAIRRTKRDAVRIAAAGNRLLDAMFPESKYQRQLKLAKHARETRGEIV